VAQQEVAAQWDLPPEQHLALRRRRPSRWWWLAGAVVAAILVAVLGRMLTTSAVYYRTPTEVLAQPGQDVRVAGRLVPESLRQEGPGDTSFSVTDGRTTVPVRYTGGSTTALGSAQEPGAQVVVQGMLGGDGVFHAHTLMAKCPSKFSAGGSDAG
jgi:cytochrome c-type biogenesis protein CcmE